MLLLAIRCLVPGHAVALRRRGAWNAHVALHAAHAAHAAQAKTDAVAHENEAEREQDGDGDRGEPVRIGSLGNLARGDEGVGAWLTRLDAIPTEQHAYRGDAMKKDVLWETLADAAAPADARMAAARVLRRRYGADEGALVRVVEDPDVRVRVEAALEEHDEAERAIETLGPLFRAR